MNNVLPAWLDTAPEPLYGMDAVTRALDRVAAGLGTALAGTDPMVLCLVQGGIVTTGLLLPRLDFPLELDYLHVDRYRGTRKGGAVRWIRRPRRTLDGRVVLLIDDVLDRGMTLAAAVRACRECGAARVCTAVLADKQVPGPRPVEVDFAALRAPDRFLVGCGLDYRGYLRNLPGLYALP